MSRSEKKAERARALRERGPVAFPKPELPKAKAAKVVEITTRQKYVRRESGLDLLAKSGKISTEQKRAGERYGRLYRIASIQDVALIKSALADIGAPRGGTKTTPGENDYATAQEVLRSRSELAFAQLAVHHHFGLVGALDVICGKEWTPSMVTAVRREREQIETGLRIALDLLSEHFRAIDAEAGRA